MHIIYKYTHICYIYFIHSSADGHLSFRLGLTILNSAAVNIRVHLPFKIGVFVFSGYIRRSGIVRSYDSSVVSFFRNLHTISIGDAPCFHVLAVVNSAAMNVGLHVYFWIMFFSRYMPRNSPLFKYTQN